jgi:hypothetical protein
MKAGVPHSFGKAVLADSARSGSRGLDVTVHQARIVCLGQRVTHLRQKINGAFDWQRA